VLEKVREAGLAWLDLVPGAGLDRNLETDDVREIRLDDDDLEPVGQLALLPGQVEYLFRPGCRARDGLGMAAGWRDTDRGCEQECRNCCQGRSEIEDAHLMALFDSVCLRVSHCTASRAKLCIIDTPPAGWRFPHAGQYNAGCGMPSVLYQHGIPRHER
jgi:hypothetical protein